MLEHFWYTIVDSNGEEQTKLIFDVSAKPGFVKLYTTRSKAVFISHDQLAEIGALLLALSSNLDPSCVSELLDGFGINQTQMLHNISAIEKEFKY